MDARSEGVLLDGVTVMELKEAGVAAEVATESEMGKVWEEMVRRRNVKEASRRRWETANRRYSTTRRSVVIHRDPAGSSFAPPRKQSKFEVDSVSVKNDRKKDRVFGERMTAGEVAALEVAAYEKPADLTERLRRVLSAHFIFESVDELHLDDVVAAMAPTSVDAGARLFEKGAPSDAFYAVEAGYVKVGGREDVSFGPGETLGDAALVVEDARRAVDVDAGPRGAELWRLDRDVFRKAIASLSESRARAAKAALGRVPVLKDSLTSAQLGRLSRLVSLVRYQAQEQIITKGAIGTDVYLIDAGRVACRDADGAHGHDLVLGPGQHFGERALLYDEARAANVVALDDDTRCFVVTKEVFAAHLGGIAEVLDRNHVARVLAACFELDPLDDGHDAADGLAASATRVRLEAGDRLDPQPGLVYVVQSGRLHRLENDAQHPGDYCRGDVLGDPAAFADSAPTKALIVGETDGALKAVDGPVVALAVGAADLAAARAHCVSSSREDALLPEKKKTSTGPCGGGGDDGANTLAVDRDDAEPEKSRLFEGCDEFDVVTTLGAGSFGKVKLVKHQASGLVCALKILLKAMVIATRQITNVRSEKELLTKLRHPMIARCYGAFADADNLYLTLELVLGGELYSRIHSESPLALEAAAFYAGNVALALEYCHARRIVYRDLKPENLLVDQRTGYLKLVDFGFAKALDCSDMTYTVCGTPEYMAPEVLAGSGHAFPADWWSLGCLLHELVLGRTPFVGPNQENAGNQVLLFKAIAKADLVFLPHDDAVAPPHLRSLLAGLLAKDWHLRLGASLKNGAADIKRHPFFAQYLDWASLAARTAPAPWRPTVTHDLDASNFNYDQDDDDDQDDFDLDDVDVDKFDFSWWPSTPA